MSSGPAAYHWAELLNLSKPVSSIVKRERSQWLVTRIKGHHECDADGSGWEGQAGVDGDKILHLGLTALLVHLKGFE